ncbi:MAG TPA: PEP-CTERM sorting domain-containing protein [Candidatus Acidoferrales bacterium]|nr:PEP-CTERM sorting domain-containing protein [Candidatus Acidoferrales bacterium]
MKNISNWLLLFALLLCVPVAYADGAAFGTLPSPNGVNDGGAYVSPSNGLKGASQGTFYRDSHSAGNTDGQSGNATGMSLGFDNYDEAAGRSSQSALQPHNNWIAAGPHVRELVVTTPEPNMILMLAAGLLGVAFLNRRKVSNPLLNGNLV